MIVKNGFVINPPNHVLPSYRISPFSNRDISEIRNNRKKNTHDYDIENYFSNRFRGKNIALTTNGRSALENALTLLKLLPEDVVTIYTTTNNLYISSCVTTTIEKFCKWSRKVEKKTKVILVNHEFGFCDQNMSRYASLGYPIIEDFAHSFISDTNNQDAGLYSDFLIFSLPKFFPVQLGGILVHDTCYKNSFNIENEVEIYIKSSTCNYLESINEIKEKRLINYNYYIELFSTLSLTPCFRLQENDCPGVFCFKVPSFVDLQKMKIFLNANGVESSVFYGKKAYFVPCHQNLEKCDIDYIFMLVKFFLEKEEKNGVK